MFKRMKENGLELDEYVNELLLNVLNKAGRVRM